MRTVEPVITYNEILKILNMKSPDWLSPSIINLNMDDYPRCSILETFVSMILM